MVNLDNCGERIPNIPERFIGSVALRRQFRQERRSNRETPFWLRGEEEGHFVEHVSPTLRCSVTL